MKNLKIALERIEKRKRATNKAKKELKEILDLLSEKISDSINGYYSPYHFKIDYHFWNGQNYTYLENDEMTIGLIKGNVDMIFVEVPYEEGYFLDNKELEKLDYINLTEAVKSLEGFVEKISKIRTYEEEAEKLTKVKNILKGNEK